MLRNQALLLESCSFTQMCGFVTLFYPFIMVDMHLNDTSSQFARPMLMCICCKWNLEPHSTRHNLYGWSATWTAGPNFWCKTRSQIVDDITTVIFQGDSDIIILDRRGSCPWHRLLTLSGSIMLLCNYSTPPLVFENHVEMKTCEIKQLYYITKLSVKIRNIKCKSRRKAMFIQCIDKKAVCSTS